MNNQILQVKVMTPAKFLYYGQALSVSSKNSEGNFDILPEHANFITLIENQSIKVQKTDKKVLIYNFHQAIIMNTNNEVSIYAEPTT